MVPADKDYVGVCGGTVTLVLHYFGLLRTDLVFHWAAWRCWALEGDGVWGLWDYGYA